MRALIAVLAFIAGASLVLWLWSLFWPHRLPFLGRRRPAGPEQEPVRLPSGPGYWERLEQAASQAGLPYRRLHFQQLALVGTGLGLLLAVLGQTGLGLVAVGTGVLAPRALVGMRRRQRLERLQAQLSAALSLAASTLRAGGTLLQALENVSHQVADPLGHEFRLVLKATRLGVPVAEALGQMHQRIPLASVAALAVVARVTSELGGDAAAALDRVAQSVQEMESFRRTVRAHTTEGRLSAMLVTGLPFLIMGFLAVMAPDYFQPLLGTPGGRLLVILCLVAIATGWSLIRRITSPDDL